MTYFPQPNSAKRAPRIKFTESVPVVVRVEGAQSIKGKLHDLSVTGGLLILSKPLEDGDFVEVQFPTRNGCGKLQQHRFDLRPRKQHEFWRK